MYFLKYKHYPRINASQVLYYEIEKLTEKTWCIVFIDLRKIHIVDWVFDSEEKAEKALEKIDEQLFDYSIKGILK